MGKLFSVYEFDDEHSRAFLTSLEYAVQKAVTYVIGHITRQGLFVEYPPSEEGKAAKESDHYALPNTYWKDTPSLGNRPGMTHYNARYFKFR